jgi:adenylosuccinate lyase
LIWTEISGPTFQWNISNKNKSGNKSAMPHKVNPIDFENSEEI